MEAEDKFLEGDALMIHRNRFLFVSCHSSPNMLSLLFALFGASSFFVADTAAGDDETVESQLRKLIPSATAMDTKLFEKMATLQEPPKASDYNNHSLTFELFSTSYKTAQASGGQFRYLTEKTPRPHDLAKEMYRSIGGARLRIVTHPVTMIQQNRITKFNANIDGRSATGTFEFHVPKLYEGKTDFSAEQTGHEWRITRLQMPGLKIDLKSDESGQWWPAEDLKGYDPPTCLVGHAGTVWSLDYSKDGTRLVSGGSDRSVRIWDVAERTAVLTIPQAHTANPAVPIEGGVLSVYFSPDEKTIATSSDDGTVKLWNTKTGEPKLTIEAKGIVSEAIFSPDGRIISSSSSALEIWNTKTGERELTIRGHSYPSTNVSPDGLKIATAGADPKREDPQDDRLTIRLWDAKSAEPLATSDKHHTVLITEIAFSPDGKQIASCGRDKTIKIWDATTLKLLQTIEAEQEALQSLSWSPDGRSIVSANLSGNVELWNSATGKRHDSLPNHPRGTRCVRFSPDGKSIATAGHDGVIRLWSLKRTSQPVPHEVLIEKDADSD